MELITGPLLLRENDEKLNNNIVPTLCSLGVQTSWYTNRRPYRSVAFGTWKVGNASEISNRNQRMKELVHTKSLDANRNYFLQSGIKREFQDREKDQDLGFYRQQHEDESEQDETMSDSTDAPSSRKYISASSIDRINGNSSMEEHPTIVLDIKSGHQINDVPPNQTHASLIHDRKKKPLFSMHRPHQRSRSVGNVTVYGVGSSPSTSAVKEKNAAFTLSRSSSNRTHGSLNAIAATKRFLKMLYDSATINGRSRSKNSSASEIPSNLPFQPPKPFFEIRYSSDLDDEENLENDFNSVSLALHNDDCDSTPSTMKSTDTDDSMNASLTTKSGSSTESRRTSFSDFQSWTEVFEHLRREIVAIRERDAQILADLRRVETQIQSVKLRSVPMPRSEYLTASPNLSKQKLGDLVESMQL